MSKKVLVISTSLRSGSNSEALASEFARGAKSSGNLVEQVSLRGKKIGFCIGCMACHKTGVCVIKDDTEEIAQKMMTADVVAFATPIYFYEMSGQMKTLLDRLNPIFPKPYQFRDVYLLATAAVSDETAMDGATKGLQGFIDCFEQARLAGVLRGVSLSAPRDAERSDRSHLTLAAYEMGKNV